MPQFTFLPSSTSSAASRIRMVFEAAAPPVSGVPFVPAAATISGTWSLVFGTAAGLEATADASAISFSGSCLVASAGDDRFVVKSGRFIIMQPVAGWPDGIKEFLTGNWGDQATVKTLSLGSDGVQVEATVDGKAHVYRWDPISITELVPVARWLELQFETPASAGPDIPAGLEIEITVPGGPVRASARFRQQLQEDSGAQVFATVETPTFGLKLFDREWVPGAVWTWVDGTRRFIEFVDVAPGRRHPHVAGDDDLTVDWTPTQTPRFTKLPRLESTGRTTDGTLDLPEAWQFGSVDFGLKHAPGAWIHWRLNPSRGPSRLDVQLESLGSGLHGLWKLDEAGWRVEFGVAPQVREGQGAEEQLDVPQIRLTIIVDSATPTPQATLVIGTPRIFALSPDMRFFGRSLVNSEALPHAPQLGESLIEARMEFAGPTSAGLPAAGQVKATLKSEQFQLEAGPRAVEAWVPGPWAGLNAASLTGANLVDPASLAELSDPVVTRDRNQGLVDLPLAGFSLETKDNTVRILLSGNFPTPTRTGPTVSALLPWVEWSLSTDPSKPIFDAHHRNLLLEQLEHQAATASGVVPPTAPEPTGILFRNGVPEGSASDLAADQRLREEEFDRRVALRDRFVRAAGNISSTGFTSVENWFTLDSDVKVKLDSGTANTLPALDWSIKGAISSKSQAGERADLLEAAVRWIAAVDSSLPAVPPLTPEFTSASDEGAGGNAEFRAANGHVPLIFRSTGIAQLDAAEIDFLDVGRVLLAVFVDESERAFVWIPAAWKSPRALEGITTRLGSIRLITKGTEDADSFTIAAIVGGNADVLNFKVVLGPNGELNVEAASAPIRLVNGNVAALHVAIAKDGAAPEPFLMVGVNDGGGGKVLFFAGHSLVGTSVVRELSFPGDAVRAIDFRNMVADSPRTQVLLVGSTNKIHIVAWKSNISDEPAFHLFLAERLRNKSLFSKTAVDRLVP